MSSFTQYIDNKRDYNCIYNFDGNILFDYLCEKIHSPSSVIMIKREVIDNVGYWDESFKRHQDWEFVTRILYKYCACSINNITVDRNITWRNNAKDPGIFEQQRLYYLKKMEPIINTFNRKERKEIYYNHFEDIAKNYFKFKKINKSIDYIIKTKDIFRAIKDLLCDGIKFAIKKLN